MSRSIGTALLSRTVTPNTKADQERLSQGLSRLKAEDPTSFDASDSVTGAVVLSGVGELLLDIIVERLQREYDVHAGVGPPQVAYKETPTRAADGEATYVKPSADGDGGQAHVKLRLFPGQSGTGYVFEDRMVGGTLPKPFVMAVDDGIKGALGRGAVAGYPMDDVRIELHDGSYRGANPSEAAFRAAGSMAFEDAANKASVILLEPIMRAEVVLPEDYKDDVLADLTRRRGQIWSHEERGGAQVINARVPLSEMVGYAAILRARTRGRGTFTMRLDRYEPVDSDEACDGRSVPVVGAPRRPAPAPGNGGVAAPEPD